MPVVNVEYLHWPVGKAVRMALMEGARRRFGQPDAAFTGQLDLAFTADRKIRQASPSPTTLPTGPAAVSGAPVLRSDRGRGNGQSCG